MFFSLSDVVASLILALLKYDYLHPYPFDALKKNVIANGRNGKLGSALRHVGEEYGLIQENR